MGPVFKGFGSSNRFAGGFWIYCWFSNPFIVSQSVGGCRSIGDLSIGDPIPYIYIYVCVCSGCKSFRFYELNCISNRNPYVEGLRGAYATLRYNCFQVTSQSCKALNSLPRNLTRTLRNPDMSLRGKNTVKIQFPSPIQSVSNP